MPQPVAPRAAGERRRGAWRRAGELTRRTLAKAWHDRIFGLSAEAGFWQVLSLPPLLLAVLGTIGFFGDDLPKGATHDIETSVLNAAQSVMAPSAVNTLLRPSLHHILTGGRADVVSVAFFFALWSGSSAMATYVNTITIAYDLRDRRGAVRSRLLALAIYLAGVAIGVVLLPLLVLGPNTIDSFAPSGYVGVVTWLVRTLYWPVVVSASVALVATLYHVAVPVRTPWRRDVPGALLAMALWLLGSFGLRYYMTFVFNHQSLYGSLGSPIAILLFFYVTAFAVLLGAELNAQVDRMWPLAPPGDATAEPVAGPPCPRVESGPPVREDVRG